MKFFTLILGLVFSSIVYGQTSETFSNQQFKLSIGPAKGQPPIFQFFEWSKGLGASVEYNRHFSKRFSWGCELGFTFDHDNEEKNYINFYTTTTGQIDVTNTQPVSNFMRMTYNIIPQISYHFINRKKININLTGGFGLMSNNFSSSGISPNGVSMTNVQRTFIDLVYIANFALSIDYKVSPNVFVGLKLQDHLFSTETEFRSLRASVGYVIN